MNAPVRIRTHSADGYTVVREAPSVAEALDVANLDTREGRIAAIGRVAEGLALSKDPKRVFVGNALLGWLETDRGRLERDFFKVLAPRSHQTVARIWRAVGGHLRILTPPSAEARHASCVPIKKE